MSTKSLIVLCLAGLWLSACGTAATPAVSQITLDDLASLNPDYIFLQLDIEPGLIAVCTTPPFTLYADGTVIYRPGDWGGWNAGMEAPPGSCHTLQAKLSPEETVALAQQVLDYGFERLEGNYRDFCGEGPQVTEDGELFEFTGGCRTDQNGIILRVRLPSGELRQTYHYDGFSNEPQVLSQIVSFLHRYTSEEASPYIPFSDESPRGWEIEYWQDLRGANLSGTDLWGVFLYGVDLREADLREANLFQAFLYEVDLRGANLEGSDLSGTVLDGTVYDDATIWPDGFDPEKAGAILVDQ